ncbi:ankyrin repeat protein [Moumouvirus australiensis]|uniref:Ankyrin repeat protein n=1 Tax=Moumouvirus australiensis TaxID=2109587 RepID=A0A2P1EMZ3_9VIRU|nr:ankyrin repeat protein [Moumouvirus australiensis]AVL95253.1 ankyrin repeat protein [Moumouvirus australiensis]
MDIYKCYFKITNEHEIHHNHKYETGLNILDGEFNEIGSCVSGRLYFCKPKHILKYIEHGIYLREVFIDPTHLKNTNNLELKCIKDDDKFGANMIYLGQRYNLSDPKTFQFLESLGVNISQNTSRILYWASEKGFIDIIEYLINSGIDHKVDNEYSLRLACKHGHFNLVKYLIECGSNFRIFNDCALRWSAEYGHYEIFKYLIQLGCDLNSESDYALKYASKNNHKEIIEYIHR